MWTDRRSGGVNQRGNHDHRDPFERDRTRVIHSPAFRRLQRKTQILGTKGGDFHRTRLTHSLEVESIGRALVRNLIINQQDNSIMSILPSDDLISVVCLLHDIGHPPFGHGGEVALNFMMRVAGGFESNAQSLRLLTKIDKSYGDYGLDLTRRSLLGILKYPVAWSKALAKELPETDIISSKNIRINDWLPPKAYFDEDCDIVEWLLLSFTASDQILFQEIISANNRKKHSLARYKTFDCSIMNIADDIAYGVHDLEDAIHLHLINRDMCDTMELRSLLRNTIFAKSLDSLLDSLFAKTIYERKQAIGMLVNYLVTSIEVKISNNSFASNLLKYNACLLPEAYELLEYFKNCVYKYVIDSQAARISEYSGQVIIQRLFEAFSSNPENLLDSKNRVLYKAAEDKQKAMRIICDYIASMTDDYAYQMYEMLFGFSRHSTLMLEV